MTSARRLSMLHAPLLSFYSKPFCRDVADHWTFGAPLFLLIVFVSILGPFHVWRVRELGEVHDDGGPSGLAIMSLYPAIILQTALQTAGWTFRFYGLPLFLVSLAYLRFGVEACRADPAAPAVIDA